MGTKKSKQLSLAQKERVIERVKMVELSRAGFSIEVVSNFSSHHVDTIKRWLRRIAAGEQPVDRHRSGRPLIFGEDIQIRITAFFCQMKPLPGCNALSLRWAERYFRGLSATIVEGIRISRSSISRILRSHSLRPHLHKYYLQIMDPDFFPKMENLLALYLDPPKNLFCFDECPGIQALRRVAPSLSVAPRHKRYSEPNYNRMGTTDLYAFLEVSTGKVFGRCTENHQVEILIDVFTEHVNLQRSQGTQEMNLHYVCDNLANHSCHEFCGAVAKLCGVEYPQRKLNSKAKRQQWLQQEDKNIIIYFTPTHGSWLNMVEIWFGILSQRCLKYSSFDTVDDLTKHIEQFIDTWDEHFAHPFDWRYKGEELHGKAVRRFIRHIITKSPEMGLSFLVSQFKLMRNLMKDYFGKVEVKDWQSLIGAIEENKDYLHSIITESEQPRLKKQAVKVYEELLGAWESTVLAESCVRS